MTTVYSAVALQKYETKIKLNTIIISLDVVDQILRSVIFQV